MRAFRLAPVIRQCKAIKFLVVYTVSASHQDGLSEVPRSHTPFSEHDKIASLNLSDYSREVDFWLPFQRKWQGGSEKEVPCLKSQRKSVSAADFSSV